MELPRVAVAPPAERMGRVRAADPESAELADVAIAAAIALEAYWEYQEQCPLVGSFWRRIRIAVETRPVADLQTALDAARGLRDVRGLFPLTYSEAEEVAARIEQRAWERERRRLGIKPRVSC
jgi:hypothetical protein